LTKMALLFNPEALDGFSQTERDRLIKKIDWLWINRLLITHFPLSGDLSGFFKRRVGKYRIIYTLDEASDEMIIHMVGLRDSIYETKF
jgi:mRNA interferase RelE/StbE